MADYNYTCLNCLIAWYSSEDLPPITVCPACRGTVFERRTLEQPRFQPADFQQLDDEERLRRLHEITADYLRWSRP